MNKVIVPWKAYPMDRSGVKSPVSGQVEIVTERIQLNLLHDAVTRKVYQENPSLRSTPIIVGRFYQEKAA